MIQLTISLAGEGKTRTNLAVVLASAGYCVALVDANLRRSRSPIDFDGTNRMSIYPSVDGNFGAGLADSVAEAAPFDRGEQTPSWVMTQVERFVRRNRVDERNAAAIGLVFGLVALLAGAEPTGSMVIDAVLVVLSVGVVVWASASAPWWAPAGAAGIAAVIAFQPLLAVIAAMAFVVGLVIGVRRRDQAELRAVVAGVALNVLIRSELDGFFGLSAIIGISIGVALFVVGVRRRPSAIRRLAWIAAAGLAGVAMLGLFGLAVAGASSRSDVSLGARQARQAITTLNSGDYQGAAALFADSSSAFGRADDRLGGLLALPSRLIPGVSQNVTAGADLADSRRDGHRGRGPSAAIGRPVNLARRRRSDRPRGDRCRRAAAGRRATGLWSTCARCPTRWTRRGSSAPLQDQLVELDERLDDNEPRLAERRRRRSPGPADCSAPMGNVATSSCSRRRPSCGGSPGSSATTPRSPPTTARSRSPSSAADPTSGRIWPRTRATATRARPRCSTVTATSG